jgi:hypothetical protein
VLLLAAGYTVASRSGEYPPRLINPEQSLAPTPFTQRDAGVVTVRTCSQVSDAHIAAILRTQVQKRSPMSATRCAYNAKKTGALLVRIEVGHDADVFQPSDSVPQYVLTYPAGAVAPDGSGRRLGNSIRVRLAATFTDSGRALPLQKAIARAVLPSR